MEDRCSMKSFDINATHSGARAPEARYAYYRRCQVFRKNGEQCKAPAEKGVLICHAHTREQATALRRKLELMVVLAEAVRRMRARGKPEFEVGDIFMDFNAIQITLAVMAQALIDGRIDCKTAGRLAVGLQTASKLLWMVQCKRTSTTEAQRHGEEPGLPQICAEERRLSDEKASTTKDKKGHEGSAKPKTMTVGKNSGNMNMAGNAKTVVIRIPERAEIHAERANGPPEWARAA